MYSVYIICLKYFDDQSYFDDFDICHCTSHNIYCRFSRNWANYKKETAALKLSHEKNVCTECIT